jgi:hypothetical protein
MLQRHYHVYKLKQIYSLFSFLLFTSDDQMEAYYSSSVGKLVGQHLPLGSLLVTLARTSVLLAS